MARGQTDQVHQSTPTLRDAEAECPFPVPGCPMPSFTSSTCDPAAFFSRFQSGVFRRRYMTSQRPSCDLEAAASSLPPQAKNCRNYAAAYPNLWMGALLGGQPCLDMHTAHRWPKPRCSCAISRWRQAVHVYVAWMFPKQPNVTVT